MTAIQLKQRVHSYVDKADDKLLRSILALLKEYERSEIPVKNKAKSKYNPDFVAKIKESEKNVKAGKYKVIKTEDLWK